MTLRLKWNAKEFEKQFTDIVKKTIPKHAVKGLREAG